MWIFQLIAWENNSTSNIMNVTKESAMFKFNLILGMVNIQFIYIC